MALGLNSYTVDSRMGVLAGTIYTTLVTQGVISPPLPGGSGTPALPLSRTALLGGATTG